MAYERGQSVLSPSKHNHWSSIFEALAELDGDVTTTDGFGRRSQPSIDIKKLRKYLRSEKSLQLELQTGLPKRRLLFILQKCSKADTNKDGLIVQSEWETYCDKYGHEYDFLTSGISGGTMKVLAYAPFYSCKPPTVFLLFITIIQIVFFLISVYSPETLGIDRKEFGERGWPIESFFIYNPYRRREAWRFLTYMFLHGDIEHITFNCLMQLLVGIPIEMSQLGWVGSLRVGILYISGVVLGVLGASVTEPKKFLLGASAGVYALIFAHLATLVINWKEDGIVYTDQVRKSKFGENDKPSIGLNPIIRGLRLAFVLLFAALDIGQAIYKVHFLHQTTSTSYVGHFFGALAGVLVGIFLLENRKVEDWEKIVEWIALVIYAILVLSFVAWHIIGTETGFFPDQRFP